MPTGNRDQSFHYTKKKVYPPGGDSINETITEGSDCEINPDEICSNQQYVELEV